MPTDERRMTALDDYEWQTGRGQAERGARGARGYLADTRGIGGGAGSRQFRRGMDNARFDTGGMGYDPAKVRAAQIARDQMRARGSAQAASIRAMEQQMAQEQLNQSLANQAGAAYEDYITQEMRAAAERRKLEEKERMATEGEARGSEMTGAMLSVIGAGLSPSDERVKRDIHRLAPAEADAASIDYAALVARDYRDDFDERLVKSLREDS